LIFTPAAGVTHQASAKPLIGMVALFPPHRILQPLELTTPPFVNLDAERLPLEEEHHHRKHAAGAAGDWFTEHVRSGS
jgi:hypothetical protein